MPKSNRKILLHICCLGCFFSAYRVLREEGFEITAVFYNPNIHGKSEYNKRLTDLKNFTDREGIKLIVPDYSVKEFFDPLFPYQDKKSLKYINDDQRYRRKRCQLCFVLRLRAAAETAKKRRIKYFCSTLLVSPYRNHSEIVETISDIANQMKLDFFYRDFRKIYWQGRHYLKTNNLHLPAYCGCVDSIDEKILE